MLGLDNNLDILKIAVKMKSYFGVWLLGWQCSKIFSNKMATCV